MKALDALLSEIGGSTLHIIFIDVLQSTILERALERGKTSGRPEDLDEGIIRKRIDVFEENTKPVLDFYKNRKEFRAIDGEMSVENVYNRIIKVVENTEKSLKQITTFQKVKDLLSKYEVGLVLFSVIFISSILRNYDIHYGICSILLGGFYFVFKQLWVKSYLSTILLAVMAFTFSGMMYYFLGKGFGVYYLSYFLFGSITYIYESTFKNKDNGNRKG